MSLPDLVCYFCAGDDLYVIDGSSWWNGDKLNYYQCVVCPDCDARGPEAYNEKQAIEAYREAAPKVKHEDRFWNLLAELRSLADRERALEGESPFFERLFKAHAILLFDTRPLSQKEIEWGQKLAAEIEAKKVLCVCGHAAGRHIDPRCEVTHCCECKCSEFQEAPANV